MLCINLYLLIWWQDDRDKKQFKRMKRIDKFLQKLNDTKFDKLGWNWKVGKWGGWIELTRNVKDYMLEEHKRIAQLNQQNNKNSVPIPIEHINTDSYQIDSQGLPYNTLVNTSDLTSPKILIESSG